MKFLTTGPLAASLFMLVLTSPTLRADDSANASIEAQERINARQEKQTSRIQKGIENKSLTAEEQAKLQKESDRINAAEAKATADGVVTKDEAKKIGKMQNRASRDIFRKKHNSKKPQ